MKKQLISATFVFLILITSTRIIAQPDSVTLQFCHLKLTENYPLNQQITNNNEILEYKTANINKNWYPKTSFTATATYQSDALKLALPIPNIPELEMPKDQYKTYIEITQLLYDGGLTKNAQNLELLNTQLENKSIEIQLYKTKEMVSNQYFAAMLFTSQEKIIQNSIDNLAARQKSLISGIKNGTITPVHYDIIQAEILKLQQQKFEAEANKKAALASLSEIIAYQITPDMKLCNPNTETNTHSDSLRAEYHLTEIQLLRAEMLKKTAANKRKPTVALFAQAGYGRPGLNMLSTQFEPYYIAGIKLNWTIFDWNQAKNEQKIASTAAKNIQLQRQLFQITNNTLITNQKNTIEKLQSQITIDHEITTLREKIVKNFETQLDNGVITSNQYITELNALNQSKLNYELHKIQLVQAKYNYNYLFGISN